MEAFTTLTAIAAPLPRANVDTDQIMPKQFLKGIDRSGLADGFLFDMRFASPGVKRPEFILNRAPWDRAQILVVGPNFGCGSSREHAVWGMRQLGIRAIVGTQFGGIFYDNCLRNGVPGVRLPDETVQRLIDIAGDPAHCTLTIDLPAQAIVVEATGERIEFPYDPVHKAMLVRGLSAVDATLERRAKIEEFERTYYVRHPWLA
jgi:3-isopropylmalate/(R)-2-methylmalate dehydratase small subunit